MSIDEVDPFDFFGGLRCGRRAKPLPLAQRLDPGKLTFEGSHDGFDHLPGAPRHIRRLEAEEHLLSIHDRVLDGAGQGGTARLLLHPSCRVEVGEHAAAIYHGEVVVRLEADQRILAESAEWYPNMYVRRPTTRLRLEVPPGEEGLTIRLARRWP